MTPINHLFLLVQQLVVQVRNTEEQTLGTHQFASWKKVIAYKEESPGPNLTITEHTEWQRPLSDVHSIMMYKLAQAGEGGGRTPTPFNYIYHYVQS